METGVVRRVGRDLLVLNVVLSFLAILIGCAEEGNGCAEKGNARIVGPLMINKPGSLLLFGKKDDEIVRRYVMRLQDIVGEPRTLPLPSLGQCVGMRWRQGVGCDELLFVSGGKQQEIKRLEVLPGEVREAFSYSVDPNLLVAMTSATWDWSDRFVGVRAFRDRDNGASGPYLGFLRLDEGDIHISDIAAPVDMLRIDDYTFYMVQGGQDGLMVMSVGRVNPENLTVETSEVLRRKEVRLATQNLGGSVVYVVGKQVFCGGRLLCVLPEEVKRLFVDATHLAGISTTGKTVYVLNERGEIIRTKSISERSRMFGLSAANQCVYLLTEDRERAYRYNFGEETMDILLDAANAVH